MLLHLLQYLFVAITAQQFTELLCIIRVSLNVCVYKFFRISTVIDLFGHIAGISSGIKNIVRRMAVNCPNHNILTTGKRAIIGCKPAQRCMDFL